MRRIIIATAVTAIISSVAIALAQTFPSPHWNSIQVDGTLNAGTGSAEYVQIQGAASGSAPTISNAGTDANRSIKVTGKGTGGLLAGSGAAVGTAANGPFLGVPFVNGAPTSAGPTDKTLASWCVVNDSGHILNCWSPGGSSWYSVSLIAGTGGGGAGGGGGSGAPSLPRVINGPTSDTALSSDMFIFWQTGAASKTESLPTCSSSINGTIYVIVDESGTASGTNPITSSVAAGTINGASSDAITNAHGSKWYQCDGTNNYAIIASH